MLDVEGLQRPPHVRERMERLIETVERAQRVADARPSVLDLAEMLPEHFHHQEVTLYPALVATWPDLAAHVNRLRQEHEDLLDQFGALTLEMIDDGVVLPSAALSIPPAIRALRAHARSERDLLDDARRRAASAAAR